MSQTIHDLQTPALLVDRPTFEKNLEVMSATLPGRRLRPHVKATKSTALARRQAELGHTGFTCATITEVEGMAAAGLGEDLLLANEVLDATRLGRIDARVTLAVDSEATIAAAVAGGVSEVLIDVNVGLPRCGCAPEVAGALADRARKVGLEVRGVMGYEGHVMAMQSREERIEATGVSMEKLLAAHAETGGDLVSAGGTGTFDINTWATEIQAGSYCMIDTEYAKLGLPFEEALTVLGTVLSVSDAWAVADAGLKAIAMDHGNPSIDDAKVWFCSDEHITYAAQTPPSPGDRVRIRPGHIDPTIARHTALHVVEGDEVVDVWPVDLRGW